MTSNGQVLGDPPRDDDVNDLLRSVIADPDVPHDP